MSTTLATGCVTCEPCGVTDALQLGAAGVKVEKAGEEAGE